MKRPELLAPAGTLKSMRQAFAFGADAVYAGQPRYSLRVRNNEFKNDNLALGIAEAHQLGKQFFVAVNISPHNSKLKTFIADLEPVIQMQPDALIMADPGLIMLVREAFPDMPIHLSVQANTVNYAAVKFWQRLGLTRVILSRELSLDEIAEIPIEVQSKLLRFLQEKHIERVGDQHQKSELPRTGNGVQRNARAHQKRRAHTAEHPAQKGNRLRRRSDRRCGRSGFSGLRGVF